MSKAYDIIIIGGGASGLTAAVFAARTGKKVGILEHKERLGKKILATGNGKCNFTNRDQRPEYYRGNHPEFAEEVLKLFGFSETIAFFEELGIYSKERNGYYYPNSEQASSIADALIYELRKWDVTIFCNQHVLELEKPSRKNKQNFIIRAKDQCFYAAAVILSCGGCASKVHGSDGSGFLLARQAGHKIGRIFPALVQLKAEGRLFKTISGVRIEACGTLYVNGKLTCKEKGEFLFTDYGISGIPVFQISRFAAKGLLDQMVVELKLDFFFELGYEKLNSMLLNCFHTGFHKTNEEVMTGLLNKKLGYCLLKECRIQPEEKTNQVTQKQIEQLAKKLKAFSIHVIDTNSFENAQVTAGGVETEEITPQTMESKLVKGLYLTGELLDIDGTCGGYNLQWAWSTGALAGRSAGLREV